MPRKKMTNFLLNHKSHKIPYKGSLQVYRVVKSADDVICNVRRHLQHCSPLATKLIIKNLNQYNNNKNNLNSKPTKLHRNEFHTFLFKSQFATVSYQIVGSLLFRTLCAIYVIPSQFSLSEDCISACSYHLSQIQATRIRRSPCLTLPPLPSLSTPPPLPQHASAGQVQMTRTVHQKLRAAPRHALFPQLSARHTPFCCRGGGGFRKTTFAPAE